MTTCEGWGLPTDNLRLLYGRHLVGEGVELGPGHHPYVTRLPSTTVRYLDRWTPEQARELFPELGDNADFLVPDYVADIDAERLSMLDDRSQDFVIASHVLEHVANPLAILHDIHRVLRPGGAAVVLLPDMRKTSDHVREPTSLEHVVEEFQRDVRQVDDAHLEEYARVVHRYSGEGQELKEYLERQALRSIHVHAWTEDDFFQVLEYAVAGLGCRFELLELLLSEEYHGSIEFGYVLRRASVELTADQTAARLRQQRALLLRQCRTQVQAAASGDPATRAELLELRGSLARSQSRVRALEHRLARYDAIFDPIRRSPAYPALRVARWTGRQALARVRSARTR